MTQHRQRSRAADPDTSDMPTPLTLAFVTRPFFTSDADAATAGQRDSSILSAIQRNSESQHGRAHERHLDRCLAAPLPFVGQHTSRTRFGTAGLPPHRHEPVLVGERSQRKRSSPASTRRL